MPLFSVTLDRLRTRELTGCERGYFLANRYPLSDPEGAASVLDDLGRRIAAERAKHGIADPDPVDISMIRAIVRSMQGFEAHESYAVTRVVVRGRTCLRREGEDLWSFAARAVR